MARNADYVLRVLLKKEMARKSDKIAYEVEKLVKNHFDSQPGDILDKTQINRFTDIAYSSDNTTSLQDFVKHQANKEKNAKKRPWTANELNEHIINLINKIVEMDSKEVFAEAISEAKRIPGVAEEFECLFSWGNVPGEDTKKLRKYLLDTFDVDWMKSAEIIKSDDGKKIHIRKGKNSAEIIINLGKNKATVKIDHINVCVLQVEKENDERKLYEAGKVVNRDKLIPGIAIELLKRFATHLGIHYLYVYGGYKNVRETEE